jgi:hypothetical protein
LQSQIATADPGVVLSPATSRHLFDATLINAAGAAIAGAAVNTARPGTVRVIASSVLPILPMGRIGSPLIHGGRIPPDTGSRQMKMTVPRRAVDGTGCRAGHDGGLTRPTSHLMPSEVSPSREVLAGQ